MLEWTSCSKSPGAVQMMDCWKEPSFDLDPRETLHKTTDLEKYELVALLPVVVVAVEVLVVLNEQLNRRSTNRPALSYRECIWRLTPNHLKTKITENI